MNAATTMLLAVCITFDGGQDGADAVPHSDFGALQGTWVFESIDGSTKQPELVDMEWMFNKSEYVIKTKGGQALKFQFRLSPHTSPKQMDIIAEKNGRKTTMKAIYKFDGNRLIRCYAQPGEERPSEFAAEGTNKVLILKRKE